MSLWTCWFATTLNGMLVRAFRSSVVTTPCTLSIARPPSLYTVDKWESTFSLSLPDVHNLFEEGVGISSTEVAGEAVLTVSIVETIGVAEVTGITDGPFPVTRTPFFPILDKSSSFLDLIFAYMSLLNLVIISVRMEYLLKKKKKEHSKENWYWQSHTLTKLTLTLFFFNTESS